MEIDVVSPSRFFLPLRVKSRNRSRPPPFHTDFDFATIANAGWYSSLTITKMRYRRLFPALCLFFWNKFPVVNGNDLSVPVSNFSVSVSSLLTS